MKTATDNKKSIQAFAKINLCLDVKGKLPGGYHEVAMILQQIELHDVVTVEWMDGIEYDIDDSTEFRDSCSSPIEIRLTCDNPEIPLGEENLAFRAAREMIGRYGSGRRGTIAIDIEKNIPMAAGLAGGSSDCAAVIHAISCLWKLDMSIDELCQVGAELGSDVPFCVMGQAAADPVLKEVFSGDPRAVHCAVARGRGTDLEPVAGLNSYLVLSKPPVSVSTREVYQGIDNEVIEERPDIDEMVRGLSEKNIALIEKNMVNVLENFTLKRYPIVVYTKNNIQDECKSSSPMTLMSGSGPTVFRLCTSKDEAEEICCKMRKINGESYWTRTTSDLVD